MRERTKEILRMYQKGVSLDLIGNAYGISRQRVWQIVAPYAEGRRSKMILTKVAPSKQVKLVGEFYRTLGAEIEYQHYNSYFNLLINGKKVVVRNVKNYGEFVDKWYYVTVLQLSKIDFVVVLLGKKGMYIIPSDKMTKYLKIPNKRQNKSKYDKYLNNYKLLLDKEDKIV